MKHTQPSRLLSVLALGAAIIAPTVPVAAAHAAADTTATLASTQAAMDANLAELQGQTGELSGQIAEVNATIAQLEAEAAALQPVLAAKQAMLKDTIRNTYVAGQTSTLQVLVTNHTISSMADQQQYQEQIGAQAKNAATELAQAKQELAEKTAAATQKRDGLLALQGQLSDKIATTQAQEQVKMAIKDATLGSEEAFQQILATQGEQEIAGVVGSTPASAITPRVSFVVTTPKPTPSPAASTSAAGLTGSIGYATPGGNCVNEPGIKKQGGNPITWTARTQTPYIGATALWTYNHAGVVVGIWSNGDIEVRHQNFWGGQHRFPRSTFRGFI